MDIPEKGGEETGKKLVMKLMLKEGRKKQKCKEKK